MSIANERRRRRQNATGQNAYNERAAFNTAQYQLSLMRDCGSNSQPVAVVRPTSDDDAPRCRASRSRGCLWMRAWMSSKKSVPVGCRCWRSVESAAGCTALSNISSSHLHPYPAVWCLHKHQTTISRLLFTQPKGLLGTAWLLPPPKDVVFLPLLVCLSTGWLKNCRRIFVSFWRVCDQQQMIRFRDHDEDREF